MAAYNKLCFFMFSIEICFVVCLLNFLFTINRVKFVCEGKKDHFNKVKLIFKLYKFIVE